MIRQELVSPCGLYCGVCGIYQATVTDNQNLKEKLAKVFGETPDKINCHGCRSDTVYWYCSSCAIKNCVTEKGFEGCHQCDKFPCDKIDNFPVPEGKIHILRAVPEWRKLGTEAFIRAEEKLFSCPQCQTIFFRGTRKCRNCGTLVNTP